jgi:hypothetical protein
MRFVCAAILFEGHKQEGMAVLTPLQLLLLLWLKSN